ncbi:MAG: hypothetical protein JW841_06205 [Deltaproteobacteria bacterium]|nr:hypothetical protein [Deltaproteobacteria bacterium]
MQKLIKNSRVTNNFITYQNNLVISGDWAIDGITEAIANNCSEIEKLAGQLEEIKNKIEFELSRPQKDKVYIKILREKIELILAHINNIQCKRLPALIAELQKTIAENNTILSRKYLTAPVCDTTGLDSLLSTDDANHKIDEQGISPWA